MGAAPIGARSALEAYWEEWAQEGPEAWERWLPRIGEIADGIGAIIGAARRLDLLRPERLRAAGRDRDVHRLPRRRATRSSTSRCSFLR